MQVAYLRRVPRVQASQCHGEDERADRRRVDLRHRASAATYSVVQQQHQNGQFYESLWIIVTRPEPGHTAAARPTH
jgi:hypothetical protein